MREKLGSGLEDFGQLRSEHTARILLPVAASALAPMGPRRWLRLRRAGATIRSGGGSGGGGCTARILALGRLGRIGAQQAVFERRAIEPADDSLHLIGGRCFDESEALGFLRLVVADHLDGVSDEVFGGEPLLDVVSGDPGGEVAKKYGKTHSVG